MIPFPENFHTCEFFCFPALTEKIEDWVVCSTTEHFEYNCSTGIISLSFAEHAADNTDMIAPTLKNQAATSEVLTL